ncbi:two-component system chemotaxis response regulator CheY [Orenia metallireducens]|uniref:Stage 0 sporulation protein A homolog n=1 Tax=Orenia metallireducens TaxID=1413210 RepID=A0A285HGE3_9FIRM|nr:response regulator [Orenia metallireducens]PRX27474.1 two-component system chemotaxis response regulator CheY [Orenia metallireducens]SNY34663.1 two-component system, chemotaxis family, response regulator CheY [Orenia metallireducens]
MKKVLIVDDSYVVRHLLKQLLEEMEHEIVGEAENGFEACLKYKELQPDFVTMDIVMPEMDGIEAARRIISFDSDANIIMCSSMGQKPMVLEALEIGAKGFLVKPFKKKQVQKGIERLKRQFEVV